MDVERPELKLKLPPALLHRATELHKKTMMSAASSKFHLDVSATLTRMSVQHKNEDIVGGLSVDISLRRAGSGSTDLPTVIEVDGPVYDLKNERGDTRKICGVYLLKVAC